MMAEAMTSPAVAKLLSAANEILAMARELQAQGRPADSIACAMAGNNYVRAARAMRDMEVHLPRARND
jgi:ribosomal protein L22